MVSEHRSGRRAGRERRPFVLDVADLLHRSGSVRQVVLSGTLDDLVVLDSRVPEGATVEVDVKVESLNEGVVATGAVRAPWTGTCRRCLTTVGATLHGPILEVFEAQPTEGETLPLAGATIDFEPVAREAVLLELPLVPLCREDCAGLCPSCGEDRNVATCSCAPDTGDPRWGALEGLTFDD